MTILTLTVRMLGYAKDFAPLVLKKPKEVFQQWAIFEQA
jgi:hypothetical protein